MRTRRASRWLLALLAALALLGSPASAEAPRPRGLPVGCRPRATGLAGREVSGDAADRLRAGASTVRLARAGEHQLRDGRVLLQPEPGEGGLLFTPREWARREELVAEELRARGVRPGEAFHPLKGLIDDGSSFARGADALAEAFATRLRREGHPVSEPGADALAERWRDGRCRLEPGLFRELTAFVGKAALARLGADRRGAWATAAAADGVVEPQVEWVDVGGSVRRVGPWEVAARMLDDGTRLGDLLEVLLAPPAPTPVNAHPDGGPSDGAAPIDATGPTD